MTSQKETEITGYRIQRTTAKLRLHDEFEGAWVRVTLGVPMGIMWALRDMARRPTEEQSDEEFSSFFAEHFLMEWNIRNEEGSPLPADLTGLSQLPADLMKAIISATLEAVVTPPAPLSSPSTNGKPSAEVREAMEVL